MEPQLPVPQASPEHGPQFTPQHSEQLAPLTPEVAPQAPERGESHEQKQGGQGSGPTQAVVPPPMPVIPAMQPPQGSPTTAVADDTPALAADDDLIEKEWVEKAKKVIAETRHDPHLQEQAVSKLQADYLQKRYNKTIKLPSDG